MTEFWLHFCIFVNRRSLLFVPAVSSFNSSADYKTLREAKPGADLQHCLKPNQEEVKGLKATLCAAFFAFFFSSVEYKSRPCRMTVAWLVTSAPLTDLMSALALW